MNKEKKAIIIGISITILLLLLAFLILFLIYKSENKESNNNNNNGTISNEVNPDNSENTNNDHENTNENTTTEEESESSPNTPVDHDSEKTVTVYLFRGKGCPHCEDTIEFLESIANDYSYLNIIAFEVWYNDENQKLMEEVSNEVGVDFSTAVPFIVIGNTYARKGYNEGMNEGILKEIESSYENEDYVDVVEKVLDSNNIDVNPERVN